MMIKTAAIKNSILLILPSMDFNEIEYTSVVRILGKAGINIFIASDSHSLCLGKDGLKVRPDVSFFNMHSGNFSGLVIIGGSGIKNYWDNTMLLSVVQKFYKSKKIVAAICSAPVILARAGILKGSEATCYPADRGELERLDITYRDLPSVVQKNIITARDSSAAPEFASVIENYLKNN